MQLVASGTQVYSWSPATGLNNPNTSSPIARPTATTTYVITGSDSQGCFVTRDSVTISVFPYPVFDLGPDVTIPVGSGVKFSPAVSNDIVSVKWTPVNALSCTDCIDPVASPKQKTQYSATVVNNGGCTITDQITVFVICTNENLFIPNTFSPMVMEPMRFSIKERHYECEIDEDFQPLGSTGILEAKFYGK
jgi:hypothetical protein